MSCSPRPRHRLCTMRPAVMSSSPWIRIRRSRGPSRSRTRTRGRPSASATAPASDDLPVPKRPAGQGTSAGGGRRRRPGRTTSAGGPPVPGPREPSIVSSPRTSGQAASASMRRDMTRSRPPWVRSSACARRAAATAARGASPPRSSASPTTSACAANVFRSWLRSVSPSGPGSSASRASRAWSTRAGRGQRAGGLERRTVGTAVPCRPRNLGRLRAVGDVEPAAPSRSRPSGLRLVHHARPAGRRQVGQAPPVPLLLGRDHVGAAGRPPARPARAGEVVPAGHAGRPRWSSSYRASRGRRAAPCRRLPCIPRPPRSFAPGPASRLGPEASRRSLAVTRRGAPHLREASDVLAECIDPQDDRDVVDEHDDEAERHPRRYPPRRP